MKDTIISLCDLTGVMVQPWVEQGYKAVLVDPQHPEGIHTENNITYIGRIIEHNDTWNVIHQLLINDRIAFVAGFPPCTDVAVSGAKHWAKKFTADRYFQAKAAIVAEQCRTIGKISNAPWFFENPVSGFSSIFGKPNYSFHPYEYGGYLPDDDVHPTYPQYIKPRDSYPKKTCLWTGEHFIMPIKKPVYVEKGYSEQFKKLGGRSLKTQNIRSATPRGFAKAVFLYNKPKINT